MENLFVGIVLLCFIALVLGMIKPSLVIRWGVKESRSRKNVLLCYGVGLIVSFILTGVFVDTGIGTNSILSKSIEQAKVSIENKEYDKALASIELALDEESDNEEALKIKEILESYNKATELVNSNKQNEAKTILDSIDESYKELKIKEDIDNLKNKIEEYIKGVEIVASNLTEAENLLNAQKYDECKNYINTNILGAEGIEPNKFATEEQKAKSAELIQRCDASLAEIEAQRQAEEEAKRKEEEEKQKINSFTKDKAISYVENNYASASAMMNADWGFTYYIFSEMQNDGKYYYEVTLGSEATSMPATIMSFNAYIDGTVTITWDDRPIDDFPEEGAPY